MNYLSITSTLLKRKNYNSRIEVKECFHYEPNQFWEIETRRILLQGRTVILDLRAIVGFYKRKYVNSISGETR